MLAAELYARQSPEGEIRLEGPAALLLAPYRVWEV
jgi:hypothetical protein